MTFSVGLPNCTPTAKGTLDAVRAIRDAQQSTLRERPTRNLLKALSEHDLEELLSEEQLHFHFDKTGTWTISGGDDMSAANEAVYGRFDDVVDKDRISYQRLAT